MADHDENRPYLPERYRQKVRAKQQRRMLVKVLSVVFVIAAIAAVLWYAVGTGGISLPAAPMSPIPAVEEPAVTTTPPVQQAPATTSAIVTDVMTTVPVTPSGTIVSRAGYPVAPGVPVEPATGLLSLGEAETALREYYPADFFAITSVNYSSGPEHPLFEFSLRSERSCFGREEPVVFIEAVTGTPWAPGQESAVFPREKVKGLVFSTFPEAASGTAKVWYHDSPVTGGVWMFTLASGNMTLISGTVGADSGEILSFAKNIPDSGRPADPVYTQERAQSIAAKYISDHNGGTLSLGQTSARYQAWGTPSVPAAGGFLFSWERLYLDQPVDTDGICGVVDAVTGDVIAYEKQWTTPDYAFAEAVDPSVAQHEATYAVMEAAKTMYPESIESVRIISADVRWNNRHNTDTTQRPGTVPLQWKVVFDDDTIRNNVSLSKGTGWVDIQTGNVTTLEYRH